MMPWPLVAIAVPPAAAIAAWLATRHGQTSPRLVIALNAIMPGAGLVAARRPLLEVLAGVVFATVSLFAVGSIEDLGYWVPIMVVGGVWAAVYTPFNPLVRDRAGAPRPRTSRRAEPPPTARTAHAPAPPTPRTAPQPIGHRNESQGTGVGYAVAVRCTECGADVHVPVLHRMAYCSYCGTHHLVVGQEDVLQVALPERISDEQTLLEVILDHLRYQYYLTLYRRHVAPLEAQAAAAEAEPGGRLVISAGATAGSSAAAAAAEAAISAKADRYRARLARDLELDDTLHFLAPYRHGMGTMYQAAFGRSAHDQEKELAFALDTLESSVLATDAVDLPPMGKLSYLRALTPAVRYAGALKTLPLDRGPEALDRAFGDLDHKQLVRDLGIIRLGSRYTSEVEAVVWRPWWVAHVRGSGQDQTLLVDSAAGSVAGPGSFINPELLEDLPTAVSEPGAGLSFLPMQCPICGHEFDFDPDEVLHFCRNCHRVCEVLDDAKVEIEYSHADPPAPGGWDTVPFWCFPLRLRTADGRLLTDLMHLKDGIDGTFDQIGEDARMGKHLFFVPAIRCVNSRLMVQAFNQLFLHTLRHPPRLIHTRYALDQRPLPWSVALPEPEASQLAPLYLATAFTRRDLARTNVNQVTSWLFQARLESRGRLVFLPVPQTVTEPFRRYVGRFKAGAVARATGTGPHPVRR